MDEELTPQEEKVFEWIAEQASKKRTEIFFEEAMKTLDIADVMTMNFILEKLKEHWGYLVIKKIQYGILFQKESFSFTLNIDAPKSWKAYKNKCKKEEKPKCSNCGKSIENDTFLYCPHCGDKLDKQ